MSSSEEAPATAAEVQEAMQRIVATFGPDTLRAFLQELPPRCLPDLLYISELSAQNGRHQANHGNGMIMAAIASTLRTSSSHANNNPALPALGEQEESQPQQQQPNPPPLHLNPNDLEPLPMDYYNNANEDLHLSLFQHYSFEDGPYLPPVIHDPNQPPSCLLIDSDATFLNPLQNFLRTKCIEIFVAAQHHIDAPGRGSRPSYIGQLGLRCLHCKDVPRKDLARQAICYPSRRDTIFEAVRNYQRTHLGACQLIPQVIKDEYEMLSNNATSQDKSKSILKVYYAEAASELGIIDSSTRKGLVYDKSRVNSSGLPSQRLQTIIDAAKTPSKFARLFNVSSSASSSDNNNSPTIDSNLKMRKFERVCSEATRKVLLAARKEPTVLVAPQDFPTVSDEHYLLYHQFEPIITRPLSSGTSKQQDVGGQEKEVHSHVTSVRCGLCCKHCVLVNAHNINRSGIYYPCGLQSLTESSFSQASMNHIMKCNNVPVEIKNAFGELKSLATEYRVSTKRGSKREFCRKIWSRMEDYLALKDQGGTLKSAV